MYELKKCEGQGLGKCRRCTKNGKYSLTWCCFLYEITGVDGAYCYLCAKEILKEMGRKNEK